MLKNFSRYFVAVVDSLKTLSNIKVLNISSKRTGGDNMEQVVEAIDRAIGFYMVEQHINRGQMAERMGMTTNTLRWKREGKSKWTWDEILKLSEITGKTPDELAGIRSPALA